MRIKSKTMRIMRMIMIILKMMLRLRFFYDYLIARTMCRKMTHCRSQNGDKSAVHHRRVGLIVNLLESKEGLGVWNVSELVDGGVAVGGARRLHHRPPHHPCDVPQAAQGEGDVLLAQWEGRGAGKEG